MMIILEHNQAQSFQENYLHHKHHRGATELSRFKNTFRIVHMDLYRGYEQGAVQE